jgi:hypothetical protein
MATAADASVKGARTGEVTLLRYQHVHHVAMR